MATILIKKSLIFFLSIVFVITMTFFLLQGLPGNPFLGENVIPPEVMQTLNAYYGLDQPLFYQYLKYLKGFLTFDFGPSLVYLGRNVNQIIVEGFSISSLLGLQALFLSLGLGIFLGTIAAYKRTKWQDTLFMLIATCGLSLPNFVIATFLQYIFCLKLHLLPVARWGTYCHTILPTLALSAMPTAYVARLIRSSMAEVLSQEYIKAAFAKGLSHWQVLFRHALPNALLPLLAYMGPLFTYLMTGSFAVEKIFGIPGLGQWMINSILLRDYSTIIGLVVFYSMILIISNFVIDVLYAWINPRISSLRVPDVKIT